MKRSDCFMAWLVLWFLAAQLLLPPPQDMPSVKALTPNLTSPNFTAPPNLTASTPSETAIPENSRFLDGFDLTEGPCADDFGFGLIRRWRASRSEWCNGPNPVVCYPLVQTNHAGNTDNLCSIHNGTLDMSSFNDSELTRESVLRYRDSRHAIHPYLDLPMIGADCVKTGEWNDQALPGWNADVMRFSATKCTRVEEKALIVLKRDGFANFYHSSEDFFNIWLALLISELRPEQVRVLIIDLYAWGPFEALWKHMFGDINTAWEMREEPPTCYSRIIMGIYGPASPLTLINRRTTCFGSELVKAYGLWASFKEPHGRVREALWMSRRSHVWPEQDHCDDRYFMCADWNSLGMRHASRIMQNEDAVVKAIRGKGVDIVQADFLEIPFEQQMGMVESATAMVGPHGAGLTHLLFLPDSGCVFEIFIDGSSNNIHYANLASWRGIRYESMISANPVAVDEVVGKFLAFLVPPKQLPASE